MLPVTREFYTREEFAELMRYSVRTVDELIKNQKIDVHRIGRNVRIPAAGATEFIARNMLRARNGGASALSLDQLEAFKRMLKPLVQAILQDGERQAA